MRTWIPRAPRCLRWQFEIPSGPAAGEFLRLREIWSICERFASFLKWGVLLSCYYFPVFWCMCKVAYVGVVVNEYIGLLFV